MQLNSRDRLQPSLLDRLIDHAPNERQESNEGRVLNRQQLRAAVLRDLSWLFNAIRAEPEAQSERQDEVQLWSEVPDAARSVVNYGMPAFAGVTLSSMDARGIERGVAEAIRAFEPRIDPASLDVSVNFNSGDFHHNTMEIVIRGRMWSQPVPLELLLAADMDVETGHTRMREMRG
ncbi:type VI secretion system baseplate subunit TssE [Xylophilus rhododendri]|uniref:Type VI secretion system baseplate subunit TssE n=1 Tax=Xylophilus rhododendri TaxID=2697032 RepID=A0A857JCQ8_9BURK|nr:type VI secretion system baseplate subunit TssE [Xylophilus rhododendri]QHJ00982.1 type VI secretion system baseplate subunit TssE [Xylophilus rhododendri]